jgi:hypothetical protein
VDERSDGWTEAVCNRYRNWNGRWIHLRYALEHLAVGRVTVIDRRKVGAGNMPAAEKIGGYHSARAKIIGPLNPPGGVTGPVMRNKLVAQIHPRMPAILPEQLTQPG